MGTREEERGVKCQKIINDTENVMIIVCEFFFIVDLKCQM